MGLIVFIISQSCGRDETVLPRRPQPKAREKRMSKERKMADRKETVGGKEPLIPESDFEPLMAKLPPKLVRIILKSQTRILETTQLSW